MAKLTHEMSGMTLVMGGIVGVGVAVLNLLKGWDDAATKALQSTEALNAGMVAEFRHTQTEVAKIAAQTAGDRGRVSELTAKQEIDDADAVLKAKIADASKELGTYDILGNQRTKLSSDALAKIAAAEQEHADKVVVINANKKAELAKLEQDRTAFHLANLAELTAAEAAATQATLLGQGQVLAANDAALAADEAKAKARLDAKLKEIQELYQATQQGLDERRIAEQKYQADVIALEENAAAKRKTVIEGLTTSVVTIYEGLGSKFADALKTAQVDAFVQKNEAAIKTLQEFKVAVAASGDALDVKTKKTQQADAAIAELTQRNQYAISRGMVPLAQAADDVGTSLQAMARNADATRVSFTNVGREADAAAKGGVDELGRGIIDVGQGFAKTAGWSDDLRKHLTDDLTAEAFSLNVLTDAYLEGSAAATQFGSSAMKASETLAENTAALNRDFQVLTHTIEGATAAADKLAGVTLTGTGPVKFSTGAAFGGGAAINVLPAAPVPTHPVVSLGPTSSGGTLISTTPGLQGGGVVSAPSYARLAEHGPEIVLGQPSRQAFAQEFAGAIAQYLEAGRGTSTVNLVVDGKTLAQVVVPAMLEQQRRRQIGLP